MSKRKRVTYSRIDGVMDSPSRGNSRKLLFQGYEFLLRKRNVFSKRENCNFNVYYCMHNRKKGYVKCTMSIRETIQNGNSIYYVSSGNHNHNAVNNSIPPPPPPSSGSIEVPMLEDFPVNGNNNLIHVPGPTPKISRVEPYEVFEQNPVARVVISSFDTRYYRFQDIINIQLQLTDSMGRQNIPRILNTNVNNITSDIEIFFLVQVPQNRQIMISGMISMTVGFFFHNNRSFQVIGRNVFMFTANNNNNNMNYYNNNSQLSLPNNNNQGGGGIKSKKRKLEDIGPSGVGDDTRIFAVYPYQGSIRGGQFVEIFFSVSERNYMDRLLINQNSIRSCTFGGVNARFQNNVFLVEHNQMKLQFIKDVDQSLYDSCSAARFVLPVLSPPGTRIGEVDVDLVVMNHVIRKERGYTYVDDDQDSKNKGLFGNLSKSVAGEDGNLFGFSSSSTLFSHESGGGGGIFDDDGDDDDSDMFDFQRSDLIEDDVDMFMCNALFYCVAQGRLDLVRYFVEEKKFDLEATDLLGYSLRDVARYFKRKEIDVYLEKQMVEQQRLKNATKALTYDGRKLNNVLNVPALSLLPEIIYVSEEDSGEDVEEFIEEEEEEVINQTEPQQEQQVIEEEEELEQEVIEELNVEDEEEQESRSNSVNNAVSNNNSLNISDNNNVNNEEEEQPEQQQPADVEKPLEDPKLKNNLIRQKNADLRRRRKILFGAMSIIFCFCCCLFWPIVVCCSPLIFMVVILVSFRYFFYWRERSRILEEKIRQIEDV